MVDWEKVFIYNHFFIISRNKDHPKLYLWAQPWNKKTEPEAANIHLEASAKVNQEETKTLGMHTCPIKKSFTIEANFLKIMHF